LKGHHRDVPLPDLRPQPQGVGEFSMIRVPIPGRGGVTGRGGWPGSARYPMVAICAARGTVEVGGEAWEVGAYVCGEGLVMAVAVV
jgi:hypothetical protein